jgi:hypothetical protein
MKQQSKWGETVSEIHKLEYIYFRKYSHSAHYIIKLVYYISIPLMGLQNSTPGHAGGMTRDMY